MMGVRTKIRFVNESFNKAELDAAACSFHLLMNAAKPLSAQLLTSQYSATQLNLKQSEARSAPKDASAIAEILGGVRFCRH